MSCLRTELCRLAGHVGRLRQPPPSERHRYRHYPFKGFVDDKCLDELDEAEVRDTERVMRIHLFDSETRALMVHPRLLAIARSIFDGAEPLGAHSAYLPKSPRSPGISLHTDNTYFRCDPPELIGLSVAVDDAGAENGAIEIAEGSHRTAPIAEPEAGPCKLGESLRTPQGYPLALATARAGDVVAFHASALHGSRANHSSVRWRRAFVFHYANGATLRAIGSDCQPRYRSDATTIEVSVSTA